VSSDGEPVGLMVPSVRTTEADGVVPVDVEVVVHPEHQVLFEPLVDAGLSAVLDLADGSDLVHRMDVWSLEPALRDVLVGRGFELRSRYVRLHLDLRGDETEPAPRDNVRVRVVEDEADRRTFHATLAAVFSDSDDGGAVDAYDVWSERMSSSAVHDPGQWWLLERLPNRDQRGEWEAVGLVQGSRQADDVGGGWIRNYGLVPAARGIGLGGYLLRWAVARFAARGCTSIGLGADLGNTTGALEVYARAGFRELYSAERYSALASAVRRS
jgi:mycothiol synthase